MRPRKGAAEDNWHGIHDAQRRKQIQDRLAQRARRKRLANATKPSDPVSASSGSPYSKPSSSESLPSRIDAMDTNHPSPKSYPGNLSASLSVHARNSLPLVPPTSLTNLANGYTPAVQPSLTIYSGLWINGCMLGIPCVSAFIGKSARQPITIPSSLQPLPIQLNNVHHLFIDRFPLPQLRYNMIAFADDFSAEEFVADLSTMPSFNIRSGCQSWDTEGWAVVPQFKSKWAFLFEENEDFRSEGTMMEAFTE